MSTFPFSFKSISDFIAADPALRFAQIGLILFAMVTLFLLFYALRDILLRTRSFWYQFFCIVIVTLFPVIGFFIYLLIRPARTIRERELESMMLTLMATEAPGQLEVGETANVKETKETKETESKEEDLPEATHTHAHDKKDHADHSTHDSVPPSTH